MKLDTFEEISQNKVASKMQINYMHWFKTHKQLKASQPLDLCKRKKGSVPTSKGNWL